MAVLIAGVARDLRQRHIRIRMAASVAVRIVVPCRTTGTNAVAPGVDEVHFAEQIEAVGDDVTLIEAVSALVSDRVIADLAVALVDTQAEVVANGVEIGRANVRTQATNANIES